MIDRLRKRRKSVSVKVAKPHSTKFIPHHEALRVILSAMAIESLPKSIRAKLPSIVSHWLQAVKKPPLFLGKKTGKKWNALLSAYANTHPEKFVQAKVKNTKSGRSFKIGYSGVPFPPVNNHKFTFIDLFAGIGGFRVALQKLGGKCVFSSDRDHNAQKTYFLNFGEIPFGDIQEFSGKKISDKEIARAIPNHDVLAAGIPCQPFSVAGVSARSALGQKHGFSCEIQGTLFFDLIRIAKIKRPKIIFLENVANLKIHNGGETFRKIRETIERDLGYSFDLHVIDAARLVPQRRKRCYIVCLRNSASEFQFPEITGRPKQLRSILEDSPAAGYTISNRLWKGHKNRTKRNLNRGAGFTAFEANLYKPANTLVARYYKDGKECLIPQKGKNPRKLTPRECARLQGYPEQFIPHPGTKQAYRQFGNSVVVPVVEKIAANILKDHM